jgi:hypothetical protein
MAEGGARRGLERVRAGRRESFITHLLLVANRHGYRGSVGLRAVNFVPLE